jgi:transcriptional regulator with XRE-family HTH domain
MDTTVLSMDIELQQSRSVAQVVSEALVTRGITQREASERTGIPLTTLNRRLSTTSSFLVSELESLAVLLDTSVSAFFERAESAQKPRSVA